MPLWTFRLQSGTATAAACDLALVITLRWSDFKDGLFHVHRNRAYGSEGTTKTDTGRMVFLHPTVKKALLDAPRVLLCDHIVNNHYG